MQHTDWVRDVAWAPSTGMDRYVNRIHSILSRNVQYVFRQIIASCDHDGNAIVWIKNPGSFEWKQVILKKFDFPLWHVSWRLDIYELL